MSEPSRPSRFAPKIPPTGEAGSSASADKRTVNYPPTDEQAAALDAFRTGGTMVIDAGAGTGKTSTLKLLARDDVERTGIYIAYNKPIADEAAAHFPAKVQCRTAHSLAYRAGYGAKFRKRLNAPRMPGRQQAALLGITKGIGEGPTFLAPTKLARLTLETVTLFCYSAESQVLPRHVPFVPGTEEWRDELVDYLLPLARKAWADISRPGGSLPFKHDHYLKLWAMSGPKLLCDYLLLDEAQDANPVIAQVVEAQTHAQRILVGDRCQSIYGWRGAIDAMSSFAADHRLVLSQSFRFGPAVAEQANKWLDILDAPLRLKGLETLSSVVEPFGVELPRGTAVLCRTNAGVLMTAMSALDRGQSAAIVGGAGPIKAYAEAALELMAGKSTWHFELSAFKSWRDVQDYVNEDDDAGSLKVIVKLIDTHGPHRIIQVANACVEESSADVICSTAHKAKGREWDNVQISGDFTPETKDGEIVEPSRPASMLAYVSVTRAKQQLDNLGLAWVDLIGRNE